MMTYSRLLFFFSLFNPSFHVVPYLRCAIHYCCIYVCTHQPGDFYCYLTAGLLVLFILSVYFGNIYHADFIRFFLALVPAGMRVCRRVRMCVHACVCMCVDISDHHGDVAVPGWHISTYTVVQQIYFSVANDSKITMTHFFKSALSSLRWICLSCKGVIHLPIPSAIVRPQSIFFHHDAYRYFLCIALATTCMY